MSDDLSTVLGLLVVLIVAADVFRSVIVPRESTRAFRLQPFLGAVLFHPWQWVASQISDRRTRQTVRASLAPFMLVTSLGMWASLAILGFGLLFWGSRAGFDPHFATFSDALLAAGAAFSTLGVAGPVTTVGARIMVIVAALSGFAVVTVVATFVISVQAAFAVRETLVLRLEAHVTLPPSGVAILESYAQEHIIERLGPFFDAWEEWAAEVAMSHRAYPILLFFRSNDSRCEWLAALSAVLDAAALLDAVVVDAPAKALAAGHFVLQTGGRAATGLGSRYAPTPAPARPKGARVDFDEHCDRLARAGYAVEPDRQKAFEAYLDLRCVHAPQIEALAARLKIDLLPSKPDTEPSHPRKLSEPE